MNEQNIQQATHWLLEGKEIAVKNNAFVKEEGLTAWRRYFNKRYNINQVEMVIAEISKSLQNFDSSQKALSSEKKKSFINLGDAIIKRYQGLKLRGSQLHKILKLFDRVLAKFRHETNFVYKDNQIAYEKWKKYAFPQEIFFKYGTFCDFLASSQLLSQIKVTRDTIEEIQGEPCLIVDGHWMKWSEIEKQFRCVFARNFKEKVIENKETADIYTYLDNRGGLQSYHPYRDAIYPISRLNDDEVALTLENARKFLRPEEATLPENIRHEHNKERTFIVQVVSSYVKTCDTNFSRLFTQPQHPYLRIIVGEDIPKKNLRIEQWDKVRKGDVFCVGFGRQNKNWTLRPQLGQFRGPDIWEYKNCEERVVTNIAMTRDEALNVINFTRKYHKRARNLGNEIAFHLILQNCSVFVRTAMQAGGIEIPTNITLPELLIMIAPKKIQALGKTLVATYTTFKHGCSTITLTFLPPVISIPCHACAKKIHLCCITLFQIFFAIIAAPFCLFLEEVIGEKGETFLQENKKNKSPPSRWKRFFDISSHNYNLPGILQQWQRKQPSTVIYKNPIRLTIVPPRP